MDFAAAVERVGRSQVVMRRAVEPWFFTFALLALAVTGIGPIAVPLYVAEMDSETLHVGLVVAAVGAGMLTAPIWGVFRCYRLLGSGGPLGVGAALLGMGRTQDTAALLLLAFLLGCGYAAAMTVSNLLILTRHPEYETAARIGWLQAFITGGTVLGLAVAGVLTRFSADLGLDVAAGAAIVGGLLGAGTMKSAAAGPAGVEAAGDGESSAAGTPGALGAGVSSGGLGAGMSTGGVGAGMSRVAVSSSGAVGAGTSTDGLGAGMSSGAVGAGMSPPSPLPSPSKASRERAIGTAPLQSAASTSAPDDLPAPTTPVALALLIAIWFVANCGMAGVVALYPLMMRTAFDVPPSAASFALSIATALSTLFYVRASRLTRVMGGRSVLMRGLLWRCVALGLMGLLAGSRLELKGEFALVLMALATAVTPLQVVSSTILVSELGRDRGRAFGLYHGAAALATLVGPVVAGRLADAHDHYQGVLLFAVATVALAMLLTPFLPVGRGRAGSGQ